MSFNIYKLDNIESDGSDESELEFSAYQQYIIEDFIASNEGVEYSKNNKDINLGYWAAKFLEYGYTYIGVSIPQMEACDIDEVLIDLFPRKISLQSPEDAHSVIPELLSFWEYLKNKYKLKNSKSIIKILHEMKPDYSDIMNDPSNFGMAKSIMTMGLESGFDMSKEEDVNKFMITYNESLIHYENNLLASYSHNNSGFDEHISNSHSSRKPPLNKKKAQLKKKRLRKLKKSSRKRKKR